MSENEDVALEEHPINLLEEEEALDISQDDEETFINNVAAISKILCPKFERNVISSHTNEGLLEDYEDIAIQSSNDLEDWASY